MKVRPEAMKKRGRFVSNRVAICKAAGLLMESSVSKNVGDVLI
ncbi:hypothetical protein NC99_11930 [Sunxiuqinia dokdonensis]|uniref:Uncharacterized protein n=1 Tax=Sunxiuqinia dokdonensis TaxID=1409788 RepID=A0A0L8VC08_9BACT|nr:hypothetical protein NC99_11930 [Sunxiuqinia dokdonensis]